VAHAIVSFLSVFYPPLFFFASETSVFPHHSVFGEVAHLEIPSLSLSRSWLRTCDRVKPLAKMPLSVSAIHYTENLFFPLSSTPFFSFSRDTRTRQDVSPWRLSSPYTSRCAWSLWLSFIPEGHCSLELSLDLRVSVFGILFFDVSFIVRFLRRPYAIKPLYACVPPSPFLMLFFQRF